MDTNETRVMGVGEALEAVGVPLVWKDMSHCHAKANDELGKNTRTF